MTFWRRSLFILVPEHPANNKLLVERFQCFKREALHANFKDQKTTTGKTTGKKGRE